MSSFLCGIKSWFHREQEYNTCYQNKIRTKGGEGGKLAQQTLEQLGALNAVECYVTLVTLYCLKMMKDERLMHAQYRYIFLKLSKYYFLKKQTKQTKSIMQGN